MASQAHKVLRQTLELTVRGTRRPEPLLERMRSARDRHLRPVLEAQFDAASPPDRIDRIDRLEIDLGHLDPARFDELFRERLEREIAAALDRAIADRPRPEERVPASDPGQRAIELLETFARTGTLPWWVDERTTSALADAASEIASHPRLATMLVRRLRGAGAAWPRLARHLPVDRVAGLVAAASGQRDTAPTRDILTAIEHLLQQPRLQRAVGATPRHAVAGAALAGAAELTGRRFEVVELCREILVGLAARLRVDHASFVRLVADAARRDETRVAAAERALLADVVATAASPLPGSRARPTGSAATILSAAGRVLGPTAPALIAALRTAMSRAAPAELESWASWLRGGTGTIRETTRGLLRVIRAARASRALDEAAARQWEGALLDAPDVDGAPPALEPDRLFVDNAGLVLLWPFLRRFFSALDLLDGDAFRDPAAAHRAAGLLQVVATGERDPAPEFDLVLNKVLCGLPIDSPFEPGSPVTEAEGAECELLLRSCIANAPVWKKLSLDGLRGSFLLRRGALSPGAGCWELRVERETFDVVKDRLPWTADVVSLPWMESPVRVEW